MAGKPSHPMNDGWCAAVSPGMPPSIGNCSPRQSLLDRHAAARHPPRYRPQLAVNRVRSAPG